MKNKILNTIKTVFAIVSIFFVVSCSDSFNGIQESGSQNKKYLTFKVSVGGAGRTVLPQNPTINDLSDFRILGKPDNRDYYSLLGSFDTYADLRNGRIELPELSTSEYWSFVMTASCYGAAYEGRTSAYIRNDSSIEVILHEVSSEEGQGTGTLIFSLDYSQVSNSNPSSVTTANVTIKNFNGGTEDSLDYGSDQNPLSNEYIIVYQNNQLLAGPYRLFVTLYNSGNQVAYWQEIVSIKSGLTSSATRTLDFINSIYTITYYLYDSDEGEPVVDSDVFTGSLSELPAVERDGYLFKGWYSDSECLSPVSLPISNSTTVYAKWIELGANDIIITPENAETTLSNFTPTSSTANVFVFGEFSSTGQGEPPIYRIMNAINNQLIPKLNNLGNSIINLDFSYSTGIIELYNYVFSNDAQQMSIVLPDSVESIYENTFPENLTRVSIGPNAWFKGDAFAKCTQLPEIIIPRANKYVYYDENGNLYNNSNELILYCNQSSTLAQPNGNITRIGPYAFYFNSVVTSIWIGANVSYIDYKALCAPNLENIYLEDGNEFFYLSGESTTAALYDYTHTKLIYYFGTDTSFTIPADVVEICPGAFKYGLDISVPDSDGEWRYTEYPIREENYDLQTSYLIALYRCPAVQLSENHITNFNDICMAYMYKKDFSSLHTSTQIQNVYTSEVLDINDSTYTYTPISESPVLFKLFVDPNKTYKLYWITYINLYERALEEPFYTGDIDGLVKTNVIIASSDYNIFQTYRDDYDWMPKVITIPASDYINNENDNYIYLAFSVTIGDSGVCGFRIVEVEE